MGCVYQTRLNKIARVLMDRGFKYTKKNKIWEFNYDIKLGRILAELRDELSSS